MRAGDFIFNVLSTLVASDLYLSRAIPPAGHSLCPPPAIDFNLAFAVSSRMPQDVCTMS